MSGRNTLISFFETGDFPTEAQFTDLINSVPNIQDDETMQLSIVTLSSLQILNGFTTAVVTVPAQGADTVVNVLAIVSRLKFNTTAYSVTGFERLEYHETDLAGSVVAVHQGSFLTSGATIVERAPVNTAYLVQLQNVDLVAAVTVADPTLGDSTVQVHTYFTVTKFT